VSSGSQLLQQKCANLLAFMMAKMNFSEARANDAQFRAKLELQMQQNFLKNLLITWKSLLI